MLVDWRSLFLVIFGKLAYHTLSLDISACQMFPYTDSFSPKSPDLYFKPPIRFRGPNFPPWSPYSTGTSSRNREDNGAGENDNSNHDFFRLRPEAILCGALLTGLMRRTACLNVKRLWREDCRARTLHQIKQILPGYQSSIFNYRHFYGSFWGRREEQSMVYSSYQI